MDDLVLAFRNLFRNRRRSAAALTAIALACASLIVFAGYFSWTFKGAEILTVANHAHIQIFKQGYRDFGAGRPTAFAITGYEGLRRLVESDPVIGPRLALVTPRIVFMGIVSHYRTGASSTFIGLGADPDGEQRLNAWNPYGLTSSWDLRINRALFDMGPELESRDPEGGTLGIGLARVLGLGDGPRPPAPAKPPAAAGADLDFDFLKAAGSPKASAAAERPSVELLCAPPGGGVPNVGTLYVRKALNRATSELDDQLIKLPIGLASELVFPGEEVRPTSVLLLLKETRDVPLVMDRLGRLFQERGLALEARTWEQLQPFAKRLIGMFRMMFAFMSCIVAVILGFLIYNTMAMSIVERIPEIGTLRAMGLTRGAVVRLLLLEGGTLGLLGGLAGALLGIVAGEAINAAEIVYLPPTISFYAKLGVLVLRDPQVIVFGFAVSVVAALASSVLPARRAANLQIVDALRHV